VELSWVDNQGFYVSQYGGIGSTTGQTKIQGATLHTVRTLSATTLTVDTTTTDYIILVQTTTIGATCTITLPNPALNIGRILFIKDSQGTANTHNIVIARFGSESIEGVASSYTMTAAWDSKQITTDGTNWFFL
jgi:hypothetical protein